MVNFLLSKKNVLVYGTYRRKKIQSYLPYTHNKNYKSFKAFQIDFLKSPKKLLNIIKNFKPEYIIDFASICMVNQSWNNPKIYFQINVLFKAEMLIQLKKFNFNFQKNVIEVELKAIDGNVQNFFDKIKFSSTSIKLAKEKSDKKIIIE